MSDFTPYDRAEGESDIQFLGMLCYRNLGQARDLTAAYAEYCKKRQEAGKKGNKQKKPSSSFYRWFSDFHWDDRVKIWDKDQEDFRRHSAIEAQGEKWLQETQTYQENLYAIGLAGMIFVNDWLVISRHIIRPVADRVRMNPDVPLSKEDKDVFYKAGKPAEVMAIADKASMLVAESKNLKEFLSDYQSGDRT